MSGRRLNFDSISAERLTLPASIEDGRIPGFARAILYCLSGLVLLTIFWLSIAEVKERVRAHGTLVPVDSVQTIEHLEGGIIEAVLVEEGQIVRAGTPLVRLRATATTTDLEQLNIRLAALELEQLRIDATRDGHEPDFGETGARYPQLAADQMRLFTSDRTYIDKTHDSMVAALARANAEIRSLESQKARFSERVAIGEEQLAMRETLLKDGFTSRSDYLEAKFAFEQARTEFIAVEGRLDSARETLVEAQSALARSDAEADRRLATDRSRSAGDMAEVQQQRAKQSDRVNRLEIRASVDSVIQYLAVQNPGEVLNAGDIVARIVPLGAAIDAEVRIRPQDVAQVKIGQLAEMTVSAFDPNVYGIIQGEVRVVSPSTFQDEDGQPYYKASIEIDGTNEIAPNRDIQLLPGMTIEAGITTDAKSIMRYLLKPVYRSLGHAFSEP